MVDLRNMAMVVGNGSSLYQWLYVSRKMEMLFPGVINCDKILDIKEKLFDGWKSKEAAQIQKRSEIVNREMTKAQKARLDYIKTRHKRNYTLEGVGLALVDSQAGDVISIGKLVRKSDGPREIVQIMNTMAKYDNMMMQG